MAKKTFRAGESVRFSAKFLSSVGYPKDGRKVFKVRPCECGLCRRDFVAVDQRSSFADNGMYTADEVAKDPSLEWRHVHTGNLLKA